MSSNTGWRAGLVPDPRDEDATDLAVLLLRAVAHPMRFRILQLLVDRARFASEDDPCRDCEVVCACRLRMRFHCSAPDLSHHLKLLREAGLIETRREGARVHYVAVPDGLAELRVILTRLAQDSAPRAARVPV